MRVIYGVIFLFIFRSVAAGSDTVPVFLLDYDQAIECTVVEPCPFSKTSSFTFTNVVEDMSSQSSGLIIFVEESFCAEDISARSDRGTPYYFMNDYLKNNRVKYIPQVENPMGVVTRLLKPSQSNVFVMTPGQPFELIEKMRYFHVFFKDMANETRVEALRRHDTIIDEVYMKTREEYGGHVAAIYTGKFNPMAVEKTTVKPPRGRSSYVANGVYVRTKRMQFRFIGMNMQMPDRTRRSQLPDVPQVVSETHVRDPSDPSKEYLKTSLEFQGLQLKFSFQLTRTHWYLDNVTLVDADEELGSTILGLKIPVTRSYFCNEPLVILNGNDNSYISIPEYQMQPFKRMKRSSYYDKTKKIHRRQDGEEKHLFESPAPEDPMSEEPPLDNKPGRRGFDPALHCNPYYNITVLTSFLVIAMLVAVELIGLSFLFQCSGNTKFDDPQGKQIIITTSE